MDKLLAIFGDVHSNWEALQAVMEDCRREGVTDYLCTGDIVGYNADPHKCLELIRSLNCPVVKGNHDHYVSMSLNLMDFNPSAAAVIEWTREALSEEEKVYLQSLPFTSVKMGITLVHATMDDPQGFGYVFDHLQAEANFSRQVTPVCFHGHTHCPMIYEKQMSEVYRIDAQDWKLPLGKKYFINVGSVGQPRDGDPRAAYVLYNPGDRSIRFRRVEYDIATAQAKVRAAGLPERLALRLQLGR